jgi:hypothetical protein
MSIPVEAAGRAAEALVAYWTRSPGQDLRTRDLCRRLAEAVERESPIPLAEVVKAEPGRGAALVREALLGASERNPAVRGMCAALVPESAAAERGQPPSVVQNVSVTGDGNPVLVVGGSVSGVVMGSTKAREAEKPAAPGTAAGLKILFAASDPSDQSRLRVQEEVRRVREQIDLARNREGIEFDFWTAVRPEDFVRALLQSSPTVVHFSGHGSSTGELCFQNDAGRAHPVRPETLRNLFREFTDHVRCVVLNACYAETQARAIAEHVPFVVGMSREIGDKAAMAFSAGFYQAMADGRDIPKSFRLGCTAIELKGFPGHDIPVLVERRNSA